MIATSGEWLGNAGAVQAATKAAVPSSNAESVVGQKSFADAMRQSDAIGSDGRKNHDVANGIGERIAAKIAVAKAPTRRNSVEALKQLNHKDAAIADGDADSDGSVSDVVSEIVAGASPVAKSDAAAGSPQGLVAAPSVTPAVETIKARTKVAAVQWMGEGKAAVDDVSKAKGVVGKNTSHVVAKGPQAPANVLVSNAVVISAVSPQAASVAPVDLKSNAVPASVEMKNDKKALEQGVVLPAPVASVSDVTTDTTLGVTDTSGAMSASISVDAANVTTAAIALHIGDMPSIAQMGSSIPVTNTVHVGTPPIPVKREVDGAVATVASHAQNGAASELRLSTFEAAKPGQLEVGLRGGEFGWLKVRAELGANGEVNAYLRGASASTTDLLQTTAPRIETYLGAQDVAVRSVQVESAHMHSGASSSGLPTNGDATAGGASQQRGSGDSRHDESVRAVIGMDDAGAVDSVEGVVPVQLVSIRSNTDVTGTGNWLSVRA